MKLSKKYKENKAILIDEEKLKDFDRFLNGFFSRRKYKCICSDDSELEFNDLQEILDYENPDFRKIIEIEIYADNKTDTSSLNFVYHEFRIELGGPWRDQTLKYSIDSKDVG